MTPDDINKLLELIIKLVNDADGSWQEKRNAVYALCTEQQMDEFNEFISWFEISEPH